MELLLKIITTITGNVLGLAIKENVLVLTIKWKHQKINTHPPLKIE
jgi:hypothetical protein